MKLLLLLLSIQVFANINSNITPKHSLEKCESRYKSFIEMSDSEECNDIRYALLSYMELHLFYCPMDNDDTVIAQYNFERIQKCEKENK